MEKENDAEQRCLGRRKGNTALEAYSPYSLNGIAWNLANKNSSNCS